MKGRVKWFNQKKRFGYVTTEDGHDLFMHVSDIDSSRLYKGFETGDVVEFQEEQNERGYHAAHVNLISRVEEG